MVRIVGPPHAYRSDLARRCIRTPVLRVEPAMNANARAIAAKGLTLDAPLRQSEEPVRRSNPHHPAVRDSAVVDREVFESVYQRNWFALYRLAFVLLGSRADAEEVAQDAFTKWYVHRRSVNNPDAYLRTVVANLCRGRYRRLATARRHAHLTSNTDTVSPPPDDPIVLLVQKLPHRQKVAVVMRFVGGHTDQVIADVLGCRPATVRSLIARGLASLQTEFGDHARLDQERPPRGQVTTDMRAEEKVND
jgi:RNA polymerase sigma factor (sigma-70 family)